MTKSAELIILGTSGFSTEVAQLARRSDPNGSRWEKISYVTANKDQLGISMPFGVVKYIDSDIEQLSCPSDIAIGIGRPNIRKRLFDWIRGMHVQHCLPNIIHPKAELNQDFVLMGIGNIVCANVVMTCNVRVGDGNIFNLNVTVGHDTVIGNHCVINPGVNVSGSVSIGDECLLGTGSCVLDGISIADKAVVGAGAAAVRSIVKAGVYVGVPARELQKK